MVTWEGRLVPLTYPQRDGVGAHTGTTLPKSKSSTDAVMDTGTVFVRCVERITTRNGEIDEKK